MLPTEGVLKVLAVQSVQLYACRCLQSDCDVCVTYLMQGSTGDGLKLTDTFVFFLRLMISCLFDIVAIDYDGLLLMVTDLVWLSFGSFIPHRSEWLSSCYVIITHRS